LLVLESADDADLAARQLYRIGLDGLKGWIAVGEARAAGLLTGELERIVFSRFDAARAVAEGVLLDVRTSQEFEDGHIEGAVSIPYTRLKERLSELPQGRRVFVHCGTGRRASLAASFLQTQGFESLHVDGVCADCERIAQARGVTH
jgi:hydroxyacylglutathione hydrolase